MQRKPRVFISQVPHRRDEATGAFVPQFNLHPAEEFGELVTMFPPRAAYISTEVLLEQAWEKLLAAEFSGSDDSLLLLGDTSIVAALVATAALHFTRFAVLRYDRIRRKYARLEYNLNVHHGAA